MKQLEMNDLYLIAGGNFKCPVALSPKMSISPPLPMLVGVALAKKWTEIGKDLKCGDYDYQPLLNDNGDVIGLLNMAILVNH